MAADFRKRFWISLMLTLPILVLSPMLQSSINARMLRLRESPNAKESPAEPKYHQRVPQVTRRLKTEVGKTVKT